MLPSSKTFTKKTLLVLSFAILFCGLSFYLVQPAYAQESISDDASAAYLVQFQPNVSAAERAAWLASQNLELVSWLPQINVAEVRGRVGNSAELFTADAGPVTYIEADASVSGELVVSDPAYNNPDQGYAQRKLGLAASWDVTEGTADVVIAILDTGINPAHPELAGRLVAGYDFVNNDADPMDDFGHGTHVAGIVAAELNGASIVGVCPKCKLMPVKVLNEKNGGKWSYVVQGILYAVDNGARVINLSLGAGVSSATLESAIKYAQDHNVVVVAAAGNGGSETVFYPAALPYVIAVGATDRNDVRWSLSNYGDFVDVVAPGVNIYSAYHDLGNTTGYAYMTGTSMATPFVSGLAGLVLSRKPELTGAEVAEMITGHVVDLGATGKDKEYGHGRIDVYATMVAANDGVEPRSPGGGAVAQLFMPMVQAAN